LAFWRFGQLTFRLQPVLKIAAIFRAAREKQFICTTRDFFVIRLSTQRHLGSRRILSASAGGLSVMVSTAEPTSGTNNPSGRRRGASTHTSLAASVIGR
jgi:hypothetical protein